MRFPQPSAASRRLRQCRFKGSLFREACGKEKRHSGLRQYPPWPSYFFPTSSHLRLPISCWVILVFRPGASLSPPAAKSFNITIFHLSSFAQHRACPYRLFVLKWVNFWNALLLQTARARGKSLTLPRFSLVNRVTYGRVRLKAILTSPGLG